MNAESFRWNNRNIRSAWSHIRQPDCVKAWVIVIPCALTFNPRVVVSCSLLLNGHTARAWRKAWFSNALAGALFEMYSQRAFLGGNPFDIPFHCSRWVYGWATSFGAVASADKYKKDEQEDGDDFRSYHDVASLCVRVHKPDQRSSRNSGSEKDNGTALGGAANLKCAAYFLCPSLHVVQSIAASDSQCVEAGTIVFDA